MVKVLRRHGDGVAATHGLFGILLADHQGAGVAGKGQRGSDHQQPHPCKKLGEIAAHDGVYSVHHPQHHGSDDGVVGNLYVVADELQT